MRWQKRWSGEMEGMEPRGGWPGGGAHAWWNRGLREGVGKGTGDAGGPMMKGLVGYTGIGSREPE